MKKLSKKQVLDLSLYVAICIWAIVSFITMIASNYIIQWQHYLGLFFLLSNGFIFYKNHQLGTLFLGSTLLLGLIGILSFNVGLIGSSVFWTPYDVKIPLFLGNPIILILLILHFILSGRYYVGIVTKNYWKALLKNRPEKQ